MTPDRWLDTKAMIVDKFPITTQGQEPLEDSPGTLEFVEFTTPAGVIRLEYELRPRITGKHAIGGHKMGAGAKVEYEYSDDEQTGHMTAWRQVNGQWQALDDASALLT